MKYWNDFSHSTIPSVSLQHCSILLFIQLSLDAVVLVIGSVAKCTVN